MEYNDHPAEKDLEELIAKDRETVMKSYLDNFERQEKSLDLIYSSLKHADYNNFKDNKLIWNLAGYVSIVSFDLKVITKDLTFSTSNWQKRHYCRQASIIIYEALKDIFELLGKDFNELTSNRLNIDNLRIELNAIKSDLNKYKQEHLAYLKKIRNISGAHRDHEIILLTETIHNINAFEFINVITSFDNILNRLGPFIQILINKAIDLPEIKNAKKR